MWYVVCKAGGAEKTSLSKLSGGAEGSTMQLGSAKSNTERLLAPQYD